MAEQARTADNGVNVQALLEAKEALTDNADAAHFKWRASCEWLKGTHAKSSVESYYGLGEEHKHVSKFTHESDHPLVFASEDNAATPVEIVLCGLAGCLTAGVAAVAQNRDIQLKSVKATLEAPMNIQGILGCDEDVRNGFEKITVNYEIDADASQEDIEALVAQSQKRSAVFDIVANPTNVAVSATKV
ncbi:MAG: OsmC family protein [Woeseiaceae bacterium]|nr:OsmC family protein [Woeseiaceae bacterium]